MRERDAAPSIVVGVDGSRAARDAAVWAIPEAVDRDIPLRLACVVDPADPQLDTARATLYDAQRTVESTGEPVKIETDLVWATPHAGLRTLSRSAELVCLGSLGKKHACAAGSVAAALTASAHCPVAVVSGRRGAGLVVADLSEPDAVLTHAFAEARLRGLPLQVSTCWRAHADRQLAHWLRRYPDVPAQIVTRRGTLAGYLADHAGSVRLAVTGTTGILRPGRHGDAVLTVHADRL